LSYEGPVRLTQELERIRKLPRRELDFGSPEVLTLAWTWSPQLLNENGKREWDRIVALPLPEQEKEFARFARPKDQFVDGVPGVGCPLLLSGEQAVMLFEAYHCKGLFASAGVGIGKTLVNLLLALIFGAQRPVCVVPGGLVEDTHAKFADLVRYWKAPRPMPQIVSYEKLSNPSHAALLCDCMKCTGAKQEPAVPGGLRPTHLFPDECDKLRDPGAVATRRIGRYMSKHHETVYCGMTGTAWRKSIKNSAPQLIWALKWGAPVPLTYVDMNEWSEALDMSSRGERRDPGALLLLADVEPTSVPDYQTRVEIAADAFQRRLLDTPGVIQTYRQSCTTPITIRLIKAPEDPILDAAFTHFRDKQMTLDGWDVDDPLSAMRYATEMGCGFFYFWWNDEGFSQCLSSLRKNERLMISATERKILNDCVATIGNGTGLAPVVARLKSEGQQSAPGISRLDTDSLSKTTTGFSVNSLEYAVSVVSGRVAPKVASAAAAISPLITTTERAVSEAYSASRATELWQCWEIVLRAYPALFAIFEKAVAAARPPLEWLEARRDASRRVRELIEASARSRPLDSKAQVYRAFPDDPVLNHWKEVEPTFVPNTVARPITASVLGFAASWVKLNTPALVWVQHDYVGAALSAMTGVPYFGSKGRDINGRYIMKHSPKESAILSLSANSRGRNLQAWNTNLVLGPAQANTQWEQGYCGRTHRQGQKRPVHIDVLISCAENLRAVTQAYAEASWVKSRTAAESKLLVAQWDWSNLPASELQALTPEHPSFARWVRPGESNSVARV